MYEKIWTTVPESPTQVLENYHQQNNIEAFFVGIVGANIT